MLWWLAPSLKDPVAVVAALVVCVGTVACCLRWPAGDHRGRDSGRAWVVGSATIACCWIAGLDAGHIHLSDTVPTTIRVFAITLASAAHALRYRSITENPYFITPIVVQRDRAHHVVDTGPYRLIRHPGNLSGVLIWVATPLALGSWLACPFGWIAANAFFRRTRIEDCFLRQHLEGYAAYARAVRHKLIPGLY